MNSREYWQKRETENQKKYLKKDKEYLAELNDIYRYTMDQVQKEIDSFYAKYATKEGITIAEARKRASKLDMEEYSRKAKKYVAEKNFSKQANEEMRLYNLTMKVNRLELLKAQIGLELVAGFDEMQEVYDKALNERTQEELMRQAGILGYTLLDNAKMANAIVNASFHNATFSERIWMHQDLLRAELDKLLRTGLIQGRNPRELARGLRKVFDVSRYNSERLMITELTRVQTGAQQQSYIRNGFDEYQYVACSGSDVCPICKDLGGRHFKVEDMMPGENAPPMHPLCHCSTAAYIDDKAYNDWLDGYKEHGLSFAEWKEKRHNTERQYLDIKKIGTHSKATYDRIKNIADEGFKRYPAKIQNILKEYTLEIGSSINACDTVNKVIKLGSDANLYTYDHEVGHMLEETVIDKKKLIDLKNNILYGKNAADISLGTWYDSDGNPVNILYVKHDDFFTDYQGRLYSEGLDDYSELFDNNFQVRPDRLWELISETLPHYMANEKAPNATIQTIFDLIKESME